MSSKQSHSIKGRTKAQDVFYTPEALALIHIKMALEYDSGYDSVWLDPCCGNEADAESKRYYNNFPHNKTAMAIDIENTAQPPECADKKDFLELTVKDIFSGKRVWDGEQFLERSPDSGLVICGNPPYSILDDWLNKSIELKPIVISYLLLQHHLTPRRMEWFDNAGYKLVQMKFMKVKKWYGISVIVTWVKAGHLTPRRLELAGLTEVTYDRTIYQ